MNIFKILASGDGAINEPNISSFFAYLIDPSEGHGFGTRVLQALLDPLLKDAGKEYEELKKINNLIRGKGWDVWIKTEFRVSPSDNKGRHIDILVEVYSNNWTLEYTLLPDIRYS